MKKDIRTLTDEELIAELANGTGTVDIPEDCSLEELITAHKRLTMATNFIRNTDMDTIKRELKELAEWRDTNIYKEVANNKSVRVTLIKTKE